MTATTTARPTLADVYRESRALGCPAIRAIDHARRAVARPPHATDRLRQDGDKATWTEGGFTLTARVQSDDDASTDFLGHFTDTWAPGAIRRRRRWRFHRPGSWSPACRDCRA